MEIFNDTLVQLGSCDTERESSLGTLYIPLGKKK